jgi:hypothetical protein
VLASLNFVVPRLAAEDHPTIEGRRDVKSLRLLPIRFIRGRVIGTDAAMRSAVPSTLFQTSSGTVAPIHPYQPNAKLMLGATHK